MARPLSQQEIDALLDTRGTEEDVTKSSEEGSAQSDLMERVEPYNFKRPRLFSQEQMRVLSYVHESFARDLSVYLSAQLRTIVDIALESVDQVIYSEFVMSSKPPSALYVVNVKELDHKMVFEMDPRLVIYTIEKLFGGPGVFLDEAREVSQIEQRIMSKVMKRAYQELEEAWQQAEDITIEETAFETNAEFVQIIPAAEPAFNATFEVTIYDEPSYINICYPYILLEKMLGTSDMKQWIASATTPASPEERERFEGRLQATDVELRAELGDVELALPELMDLQEGDVIPLRRRVDQPLKVFVNGRRKFLATPGKSGQTRAVKIIGYDQPLDAD
jgi:flagellar motor switch protein FliM